MDLAVSDGDTLAVLLGNGDGTFQNPKSYNCGGQSGCIEAFAVGDFNGDGELDVAGAGFQGLSVFLGNGDGSFQPNILTLSSVQGQSGLSVGDFNQDGKLDVAFWNGIAIGNGDGTFQSPVFNGFSPSATLVGDFNSDGVPDVLINTQAAGGVPFLNLLFSAPQISLQPVALNFTAMEVGVTSLAQDVMVTNIGNVPLKITSVAANGDYSQTNTCGRAITAGTHCTVSVTFKPTATGRRTGSIILTDNASSALQGLTLNGSAVAPYVGLSPGSVTFGGQSIGTTSSAQMVKLSNMGNVPIVISSIATEGDFAQTNTCGTGMASGSSCTIQVTFTPTANGTRNGELTVSDSDPSSPQTITLNGSGPDFTLALHSGSSSSASVSAGESASYTLSVAGVGGFDQSVTLGCTGAPSETTCLISPSSVTAGSSPSSVSVTVSTSAPSTTAPLPWKFPPASLKIQGRICLLILSLVLAAIVWGTVSGNWPTKGRMPLSWALVGVGLLMVLALGGCGGGIAGGSPPSSNSGTPTGTYKLTVTGTTGSGSAILSHSTTLTMIVN